MPRPATRSSTPGARTTGRGSTTTARATTRPASSGSSAKTPSASSGGVNLYAYVGNNPTNFIDPLGLDGGNPFLDGLQRRSTSAGMIPGIGEPLDLINGGISLARGDYAGAGLSLGAVVPFVGNLAGAAKIARPRPRHSQRPRPHRAEPSHDGHRRGRRRLRQRHTRRRLQRKLALGRTEGRAEAGEFAASGPGHAEVTALNAAQQMGLTPVNVAASRPICSGCAGAIQNAGAQPPVTPLK